MGNSYHANQDKIDKPSLLRRFGWLTASILAATMLATLAIVGFLTFLWFADIQNTVWLKIMVTSWSTRSVSISTLVLRFAIDLQAAIAGAMLASILMESYSILLRDAAKVSTMRASYPQPRAFLDLITAIIDSQWTFPDLSAVGESPMQSYHEQRMLLKYEGARKLTSLGYTLIVLLLFITTTALQFSSTVLLSDLRLGRLPGTSHDRNASYDFKYDPSSSFTDPASYHYSGYSYPIQLRTSTWLRNPTAFPVFAEYSTPVPDQAGIDDTGVLLRAFLPFADAQSRESIRNYSGDALVLDSRVSCQRPALARVTTTANSTYVGRLSGELTPAFPEAGRLWTPGPVPFECSIFLRDDSLTICQLVYLSPFSDSYGNSGGLLSEFWNVTKNDTRYALRQGLNLWSLPLLVLQARNITRSRVSEHVMGLEDNGIWTDVTTPWQTWSLSICYSAFATARSEVDMYSATDRKEPIVHWDSSRGYYTVPDVHTQLGDDTSVYTPDSRGIMKLSEKSSWIPDSKHALPNSVQPFVQQFMDVTNTFLGLCKFTGAPCTVLLTPAIKSHSYFYQSYVYNADRSWTGMFVADFTLASLFHQTLANGTGSLARAMSSLITVLSSMAYYVCAKH